MRHADVRHAEFATNGMRRQVARRFSRRRSSSSAASARVYSGAIRPIPPAWRDAVSALTQPGQSRLRVSRRRS